MRRFVLCRVLPCSHLRCKGQENAFARLFIAKTFSDVVLVQMTVSETGHEFESQPENGQCFVPLSSWLSSALAPHLIVSAGANLSLLVGDTVVCPHLELSCVCQQLFFVQLFHAAACCEC